jgi:hypothetical protein
MTARTPTRARAPKMHAALDYVLDNPGCCKLAVAEAVGPYSSRRYGYAIVDRAIKAGMINATRSECGRYTLHAHQ